MGQIDRIGTFTGEIVEAALGQTKANSYPQFVCRLKAEQYFAADLETMKACNITEPAYVDWSSYDDSIVGYLVLFSEKGPMLNYEQLMSATGWDGQDFQTLSDLVGKKVMFRVEENTYQDKTSLQVTWIDKVDASPERTLKAVDADTAKALTAKFLGGVKKPVAPAKPAAVAKPAASPIKPAAPSAAVQPATTPIAPASPSSTEAPKAKAPPKSKKTTTPPPPPAAEPSPSADLAKECTKMEAWEYVIGHKGGNEDSVIEEAWIDATAEVGPDVDEDKFTRAMWAKVRDTVLKDTAA